MHHRVACEDTVHGAHGLLHQSDHEPAAVGLPLENGSTRHPTLEGAVHTDQVGNRTEVVRPAAALHRDSGLPGARCGEPDGHQRSRRHGAGLGGAGIPQVSVLRSEAVVEPEDCPVTSHASVVLRRESAEGDDARPGLRHEPRRPLGIGADEELGRIVRRGLVPRERARVLPAQECNVVRSGDVAAAHEERRAAGSGVGMVKHPDRTKRRLGPVVLNAPVCNEDVGGDDVRAQRRGETEERRATPYVAVGPRAGFADRIASGVGHLCLLWPRAAVRRGGAPACPTRAPGADPPGTSGSSSRQASLTVPSWNQLLTWLREMDVLRRVLAA